MSQHTLSFEEKAETLRRELSSFDFGGADRSCRIPLFGHIHTVSVRGVTFNGGHHATPAMAVVLMEYVLFGKDNEDEAWDPAWISFRECRGAGPLMGYFQENTAKTLVRTFAGNMDALKTASLRLGGEIINDGASFDLSLMFPALPGIPVLLRFNDEDPPFPASCQLLFPESAQNRLSIKSLGAIGTYLTGCLILDRGD